MSDNIDVPVTVSGGEGIDRITTSIDRLAESMVGLGNTSPALDRLNASMAAMQGGLTTALGAMTAQIAEMKQVMATGFADISATNQKLIAGMGTSQARAIKEAGDAAVAATDENNMKLIMAAERAHDRQLAADGTLNLARQGMLEGARGKEVATEVAFQRALNQVAEQRSAAKALDFDRESKVEVEWLAMLEAATEKKLALETVFDRARAEAEQRRAGARALDFDRETKIESEWVAMLEAATEKKLAMESAFDRAKAEMEARRTAARAIDFDRETKIEIEWIAMLEAATEKKLALESLFDRTQAELAQQHAAARALDFDRETKIEAQWVAMLEAANEKKIALEVAFSRAQSEVQAKQLAEQAAAAERQRSLNASYLTASPASQVRTSAQAQLYSEMGGDAVAKYGSAAAAVDALTQAEWRLAAALSATKNAAQQQAEALERQRVLNTNFLSASPSAQVHTATQAQTYSALGGDATARYGSEAAGASALAAAQARLATTSREAAVAQVEMNDVLKQAEGAFRGAAHEAGIYGLAHGQLIALLGGGAVAAALHHIAQTGAEVESALAAFPALSAQIGGSVDLDRFVNITSGTINSVKDAAEGMKALAEAGKTQQQAFVMLPDVLRLAAVGNMSVAESAQVAVEMMHAFGDSARDVGHVGDVLVAVASKSNVSVDQLAQGMKSAATMGEMLGMSMEESASMVGLLEQRGLQIQPFSSAMMKLYEPSAKVSAVMQQLKFDFKDSTTGGFLPFEQVLDQISSKMGEFSKSGAAETFKSMGMTSRDVKVLETLVTDADEYHKILTKAQNAQDLLLDAAARKADTVTGAYEILGSTLEGQFVKAFEDASPIIRQVENDLLQILNSGDTQSFLSGLATGFANLTKAIIENRDTIVDLLVGYAGLRVVPPVMEALSTATVFLFGKTVATTAVVEAEGVAATTAAGQLELFTGAEATAAAGATALAVEAGAAEVVLGGIGAAAGVMAAVLGPAILIIGGVAAAFELLRGKSDAAQSSHDKMVTSTESMIGSMDKEIERLRALEEQLKQTGTVGEESAYKVALAFAKADDEKNKLVLDTAVAAATGPRKLEAGDDGTLSNFQQQESGTVVTAAQAAYKASHDLLTKLTEDHDKLASLTDTKNVAEGIEATRTKIQGLTKDLEQLARSNPKAAGALQDQVTAITGETVTKSNYVDLLKQEKSLEDQINSQKRGGITSPEKGAYKVDVSALQEQLTLAKQVRDTGLKDAVSENKRGELGNLELINEQLRLRLEYDQKAVTVAEQERAKAIAGGAKPQEIQKYTNKVATAKGEEVADAATAARARADMFDSMETARLQAHAQTLTKQGRLDEAFDEEWKAKYTKTIDNINSDIQDLDARSLEATSGKVQDSLALQRAAFVATRKMYEDLEAEGRKSAVFKMDVRQFDADVEHMTTKLAELRSRVGPGTGLSTQVGNTLDQKTELERAIPQQQADYEKAKADAGDDPEKLKQVDSMLKKIQSETAELNNIFVGLGQTIAQSLTDAFGKGGTALGGMVTTAAAYDAELKTIQSTLEANGSTEAARASAASATQDAQIKAYTGMTGAAMGFFDQNSKGYKALHAAEQAFRVFELGMAISNAVKKMSLEAAVTTATVVSTEARTAAVVAGEEGAAAAVVTGAETQIGANQAVGQSAAVTAVADQGQGDPYTAWPRMAAMAAVMAGLGFAVSAGGSGDTTAADRQAAQGTGSVLGSSDAKSESIAKAVELSAANSSTQINYLSAMAASLQAIQSNIASFASALVRTTDITKVDAGGLGRGIGASIPVLGKLLGSVFGGKQSLVDSGFSIAASSLGQIASSGVDAQTYADIKTSGGWFRSDKTSTTRSSVGDDANRQFAQVILSLGDSVKQAGSLLGAAGNDFTDKLNGFVVDIGQVSLKGLSADDIQKQMEAVFSKVGDQMAQAAIPDLQQFQQVGEGYLQTLVRVASDYANVDASLQSVGMAFGSVGLASVPARENLVSLAGGIQKFQSSTADFATNFLTKAQQQAPVLSYVNQQLSALNLGWVKTREDLAGVVLGLDLTTDSGRQTYASLMSLESAFAATHAAIVDTSKTAQEVADERKDLQNQYDQATMTSIQLVQKQRDALDESNRALFDQVQALKDQATLTQTNKDAATSMLADVDSAYSVLSTVVGREKALVQTRIDTETAAVSQFKSIVDSTQSTLDSMADAVPDDAAKLRKAAQAQLGDSLSLLKSGATPTDAQATALKSALSAVTKDSKGQFGSYEDYKFDQLKTQRQVAQINAAAGTQLSLQQKQLDTDKAQLVVFDKLLTDAKTQIDVLKGIDSSATSIDAAMAALTAKIAVAGASPTVAATGQITDLYKNVLGRTPDSAGLSYWTDKAAGGMPISQIGSLMAGSAEAQVSKAFEAVLGRAPDAAGMAFYANTFNKSGGNISEIEADLKASQEYKTRAVPAFAGGGDFGGGIRMVGEVGPEMEVTGAARIHSTKSLIDALRTPEPQAASADFTQMLEMFSRMQTTMERTEAASRATAVAVTDMAKRLKNITPSGNSLSVSTNKGDTVATAAA